jgi:hypothetical protein
MTLERRRAPYDCGRMPPWASTVRASDTRFEVERQPLGQSIMEGAVPKRAQALGQDLPGSGAPKRHRAGGHRTGSGIAPGAGREWEKPVCRRQPARRDTRTRRLGVRG